eukprot:Em0001g2496a
MGHYYYDTGLRESATHTALVTAPNCDPISAIDVISEDITGPEAPKHYQRQAQTDLTDSHQLAGTSHSPKERATLCDREVSICCLSSISRVPLLPAAVPTVSTGQETPPSHLPEYRSP